MPLHTVTKHGTTKAGKPTVFFDNQHEFKDAIYLGNTAQPPLGAVIDTEMASTTGRNGTQMWFLNKWGMAPKNAQPETFQNPAPQGVWKPPTTSPVGASQPMPSTPNASPAGYTEPERMFLSNIVAAAINSGKITDPVDLPAWMNAALYALRHVKADVPSAIDPEVGF